MALIKSISGIRGTIGGTPGDNLTPLDVVKFTAAFGTIIAEKKKSVTIVKQQHTSAVPQEVDMQEEVRRRGYIE